MSQHTGGFTPGPWEWDYRCLVSRAPGLNYGTRYVIEVEEGTVYSEYSADSASLHVTPANAALIAAAPDMYAALVKARETIQRLSSTHKEETEISEINAALTKAGATHA